MRKIILISGVVLVVGVATFYFYSNGSYFSKKPNIMYDESSNTQVNKEVEATDSSLVGTYVSEEGAFFTLSDSGIGTYMSLQNMSYNGTWKSNGQTLTFMPFQGMSGITLTFTVDTAHKSLINKENGTQGVYKKQ